MIYILSIFVSFSLGTIIAGAIFSFIAMIGVVPRLAQKTKTREYIKLYEMIIILGGLWGAVVFYIDFDVVLPPVLIAFLSLCAGVFLGSLAVSLTEVLDVLPILTRRAKIKDGLALFMLAIALGKMLGTLIFIFVKDLFLLGG